MINIDKLKAINSLTKIFILVVFLLPFTFLNAQEKPAHINEGINKERQGKVDEAIENYKKYIEKHPEDLNITIRLMNLLFRERRYNEVISLYDNLNDKLKRKRQIVAMLGRAYFMLGQKKEAIQALKHIISNEGGSESSYLFVGNSLLSLGLITDAKKIFLEGRKNLGETNFCRELYLCYIRDNEFKNAIREILHFYSDRKSAKVWVKREVENLVKKHASLIRELEKMAKENKDYQKLTGEILLELGELKRAKRYLLQTYDSNSLLNFAYICVKAGFYREAEESLKKVISNDVKEKEKAFFLLSKIYERTERFDDAIETLDKIIKQNKVLRDSAIVEKARIMIYDKKEFKKGVSIIEPLIERKDLSNRDGILEVAITGYIKSDNLERAEAKLKENTSAYSFYLKGEILFLKGDYKKSKDAFLKAVSKGLDKNFANNALERVMIIERLKEKPVLLAVVRDIEKMVWEEKFDLAILLINDSFNSFRNKEERAVLLFYKGKVYSHMGRINEAISSYTSISEEDKNSPLSPKALYKAALLYRERIRNLTMAKKLFKEVIFEYPNSVEAELSRGELDAL